MNIRSWNEEEKKRNRMRGCKWTKRERKRISRY